MIISVKRVFLCVRLSDIHPIDCQGHSFTVEAPGIVSRGLQRLYPMHENSLFTLQR